MRIVTMMVVLFLIFGIATLGATRTSSQSGNWSSISTWGGDPIPTENDNVIIDGGKTVTVDIDTAKCADLTVGVGSNSTAVLAFNSGSILTITGALTLGANGQRKGSINMTSGGTFKIGATVTINNAGTWTQGTGTIEYNGSAAQTVNTSFMNPYNNLTLSGSGTKTTTSVTVNGILSREGTATVSMAPTYSTTATLQYKGSAAQTTGNEFPATMLIGRTVKIDNVNGVTLSGNKTINGTLAFTSGNLVTNANTLTLGSAATISGESDGSYLVGTLTTTRTVGTGSSTFGGMGVVIGAGPDDLGDVSVTSISGSAGTVTANGNEGINRRWNIINTGEPTFAPRALTLQWISDDDNGIDVTEAQIYKSTDGGTIWSEVGTETDASGDPRSISTGTTSFSLWTVGEGSSPLPVELVSFNGNVLKNTVILNWKTATEVDNYGFEVEKKNAEKWEKIGFVEGHGNSNSVKEYSFADNDIFKGSNYSYRLKQVDNNGQFEYSNSIEVTTEMPDQYSLMQNHPNPFNPTTRIFYSIPQAGNVSLKIYDIIGNQVAELVNEKQAEGSYEVEFNALSYSSGVYLYKLETANFVSVKKMILMK